MKTPIKNLVLISFDTSLAHVVEQAAGGEFSVFACNELSWDKITAFEPDAVFICPNGNIKTDLEKIKGLIADLDETPVLMMSAHADAGDVVKAFRYGVKGFFLWPEPIDNIRSTLSQLTNSRRLLLRKWLGRIKKRLFLSARQSGSGRVSTLPGVSAFSPAAPAGYDLYFSMFGGFSIETRSGCLPCLNGLQTPSLLAYLVCHRDKPVRREVLLNEFWPDRRHESGRNSLNVALHAIRTYLRENSPFDDLILYQNRSYSLRPGLTIHTDIEALTDLWERGRQQESAGQMEQAVKTFEAALILYKGDFLEGFQSEEWTGYTRDMLSEYYLRILDKLAVHYLGNKQYDKALDLGQQLLRKDPREEGVHRLLMKCFISLKQPEKALKQYEKCREMLQREWEALPSEETLALYESVTRNRRP